MSGDVQPRKRKEKRRKKEDEDTGTPPPTLVNPAEHASDNVTIHIYKEGSTGGHWCARIIFFVLFTLLIGLVGVIIFEHRGTTDADNPIASSKWAIVFEGWVDDVFQYHDDEASHEVNQDEEDEHTGDDHDEEEEDEEENKEDESGGSEGQGQDAESNEDRQVEEDEEEEDEGTEGVDDEEDQTEAESYDDDGDAEEDEGISDQQNEEQEDQEDENERDEEVGSKAENDEDYADDDMGVLDEIDDHQNDESEEQNDNDDEEDITNVSAQDLDMSIDRIKLFEKMNEDDIYQHVNIPEVNDIDDSTEPLEEVEEEEPEDIINEVEIEPLREEIKEEEEETSVAVKFGVGVALVVAAHFVLVRRWKNVEDTPEVIDLTRRNTIIPPPDPKQLNVKGDVAQKQQQIKHLQELESKYKNLPPEEIKIPYNKQLGAFQASKNFPKKEDEVYNSALGKKDEPEFYTSESERFSGTEQESEYDEEDLEDEEDFEEEEEIEEDEVEEVDDHELVAKLEARYGKLSTPSQSEEEEEDIEDEEEYEEEEELEDEEEKNNIGDWKRLNAPQPMHSSVEKSKNKNTKEVSKTPQSSSRGGRQEFDLTEPVDNNDVNIQEEIEQWLAGDLDN